jgi:hypothetical protein
LREGQENFVYVFRRFAQKFKIPACPKREVTDGWRCGNPVESADMSQKPVAQIFFKICAFFVDKAKLS